MTQPTEPTTSTENPPVDEGGATPIAPRVQRPTLCRDVWYTDRQVPGTRAAKVVGTRDSVAPEEGVPLPLDEMHVHLLVFPPAGNAYNAHDVAYDADGAPGTWRWPVRIEQ